ncbi:uncharacterized protein TRAVEDRAFT_47454 [Trametes versicolor FP-101664 SS1]|uniref:uncharacterized protein n=1 Tax=Trametes versicolor (strain FP-101664) TaxID=717944 RepID=UPI0004621B0E|nr:uncharacterized protein TRAVEDRAFT_47454 [Trametes versicolor FP-101664 SS1]EIW58288.1 hypothetical protein TRAVEDRAFT_47454 [Trametes versicolor FP-101664 SS1]
MSAGSTSSSSDGRLSGADDEDATVTVNRVSLISNMSNGKGRTQEDIRLLAVSTHMTELSYAISDIQTRIFEIQELRHKSQSAGDSSNASSTIDTSLISLDERIESVSKGVKTVNESLEPLLKRAEKTPISVAFTSGEEAGLLRKHADLMIEWDAVQKESQVLREELKEDKWLTVFRTVTEQADGMMSSLEKAVNRCQDFLWQVQKRGLDDSLTASNSSSSGRSDKPLTLDVFDTIVDSYEAKKKHYMPATTKVLSIIDKGVQDRVTKNGECLRRHAECTQRWRNLKERISRTDTDMENLRRVFLQGDSAISEGGSSQSGQTTMSKNGYLATPPSGGKSKGRSPSAANTLSRSISPFRKIARKLRAAGSGAKSPLPGKATPVPARSPASTRTPSSEPTRTLRHRTSMFNFLNGGQPPTPTTPERPSHKYSNSVTPESSPARRPDINPVMKSRERAWNSSTKVQTDDRSGTVKKSSRSPSVAGLSHSFSDDIPPVPTLYKRSLSRSSMASSRPWSPVTSSVSTAQSSTTPFSLYRPPSRSYTPGLPSAISSTAVSPRTRPKTPSHIPAPSKSHFRSMSAAGDVSPTSYMQRAFSPSRALSPTQSVTGIPVRPPSRSMIPIPSVHVSSASRPGTAMSYRPDSAMSFHGYAQRAQTPENALRMTPRGSQMRLPPSSFRDGASPRTPGSRPASRTGAATPTRDGPYDSPLHIYTPASTRDPLDVEVAAIVNSIPHGLLVERVDPPLRSAPKEGEELRAQYAFSNMLGRKVITCKLTTMTRSGGKGTSKKVMCRVGGGWQDLQLYVMTRQSAV